MSFSVNSPTKISLFTGSSSMFLPDAKSHLYDKYQAFRELENSGNSRSDWEDDFGEFQSHLPVENHHHPQSNNVSSNSFADPLSREERFKIVKKILVCCKQLVHKVFNSLVVNHDEINVLEALHTEKGKNFILDLAEVYRVAQRISIFYQIYCTNDSNLPEIIRDIRVTWKALRNLFLKAIDEIPDYKETKTIPDGNERCFICHFPTQEILFAWRRYHASCANLWLNCIDGLLPGSRPETCDLLQ